MSDEEKIPEEKPESISSKPSETSVNPPPQGKVEPNISHARFPLPEEEKNKNEITETSTLNPPPKTSMEVHHHGHVHEKKKWKEYMFQFLMLFLAVFCGFLAEYQLEHMIEHNKEKQYIRSLIQDLNEDTTRVSQYLRATSRFQRGRDSLIDLFQNPINNSDTIKKAYQLSYNYAFGRAKYYFTDRTMTQLKYAGGLRLIQNPAASDSIINYDRRIQHIEYLSESYETAVNEGLNNAYNIFNYSLLRHKDHYNTKDFKAQFLAADQKAIVRYLNSLIKWNTVSGNYFNALDQQKERAIRLISTLKKEYDLGK